MCLVRCFALHRAYAVPLCDTFFYLVEIKQYICVFVLKVARRANVANCNTIPAFFIIAHKNNEL
jgi:hypothetical protein